MWFMTRPPDSHAPHPSLNSLPLLMLAVQADGHQPGVATPGQQGRFTSGQVHTPAGGHSSVLAEPLLGVTAAHRRDGRVLASQHATSKHALGWPGSNQGMPQVQYRSTKPPPPWSSRLRAPLITRGGGSGARLSVPRGGGPGTTRMVAESRAENRYQQVVLYMKPGGEGTGKEQCLRSLLLLLLPRRQAGTRGWRRAARVWGKQVKCEG